MSIEECLQTALSMLQEKCPEVTGEIRGSELYISAPGMTKAEASEIMFWRAQPLRAPRGCKFEWTEL